MTEKNKKKKATEKKIIDVVELMISATYNPVDFINNVKFQLRQNQNESKDMKISAIYHNYGLCFPLSQTDCRQVFQVELGKNRKSKARLKQISSL